MSCVCVCAHKSCWMLLHGCCGIQELLKRQWGKMFLISLGLPSERFTVGQATEPINICQARCEVSKQIAGLFLEESMSLSETIRMACFSGSQGVVIDICTASLGLRRTCPTNVVVQPFSDVRPHERQHTGPPFLCHLPEFAQTHVR